MRFHVRGAARICSAASSGARFRIVVTLFIFRPLVCRNLVSTATECQLPIAGSDPCHREALAQRNRRIRWNEYANDEHEEAISTFVEAEAAVQHFPGAELVLIRVSTVGALRPAAPWRAVKRATLWVRTGRPEPASSQQAM